MPQGPAGVAAFLLRRPLVIHEQNAVAGTDQPLACACVKASFIRSSRRF
jgi:UDP-N-acetylglucosamine--N-acetylmuramyl-(pentapeptide) pyrophosphoryl-undecaprenol N-acetylglucosamine transferase